MQTHMTKHMLKATNEKISKLGISLSDYIRLVTLNIDINIFTEEHFWEHKWKKGNFTLTEFVQVRLTEEEKEVVLMKIENLNKLFPGNASVPLVDNSNFLRVAVLYSKLVIKLPLE